ncbi:MAG: hypothetical protein WCO02_15750 [Bacteroidota bacterium]
MPADFEKMADHCLRHKKISDKVLDQFLMPFIARREGMDRKMNAYTQKYLHIIRKMPKEFFPMAMGEYIMGKTLAPDGLIHKYLNNIQLKSLEKTEREFLEFQADNPWRYCFARIAGREARDFFILRDAFSEDEFLLYSSGVEAFWTEGRKQDLYFLLTGFNGLCFHTYGNILPFRSFDADDIYFYGTEVFPEVDSDALLMASVYKDPIPYMMLASGMEFPVTMSGIHKLRQFVAVDEIAGIATDKLKETFSVQWNANIYRISHQDWSGPPHFASAYFNESNGEFSRYSLTEEGFRELSRMLIASGLLIDVKEDYSVGMSMLVTMQEILKKKINLYEYESLFPEKETNPMSQEDLNGLNRFMKLLLPYINAGTQPDLEILARQAGIEPETAHSLYQQIKNKFGKIGK